MAQPLGAYLFKDQNPERLLWYAEIMKKFLLAGLLFIGGAFAQAENYSSVAISYDNTGLTANNKGILQMAGFEYKAKSGSLNGFGLQYNYGIGISELPMNVEVGLKWSMGFTKHTYNESNSYGNFEETISTSLMRLGIPVSYIYHFNVKNLLTISPYAGLDFRFNLMAKTKWSGTEYSFDSSEGSYDSDDLDDESINWFSKDDMGGYTANRFQMGWHLGVRFEVRKIYLGLEYGTDFMPLWSVTEYNGSKNVKNHINTGNFALSLGYKF